MPDSGVLIRVRNRILRTTGDVYHCRLVKFSLAEPIVSFTFDDFPRSALQEGGAILQRHGARGTYFASTGLMGKVEPSGEMFVAEDLRPLLDGGHELGCHTWGHHDAMLTLPGAFEASILQNRRELEKLCPGVAIRSFSYPRSQPNPGVKRAAARHALCCRGGGQDFHRRHADLHSLKSFFLEQSRDDPQKILDLIDQNRRARGWLIFSTHDVAVEPSPYGCTPGFFEDIVRHAAQSGARLLPVGQACDVVLSRPA